MLYRRHSFARTQTHSINNAEMPSDISEVKLVKDSRDGLYDVKIVAKLHRNTLKPDTIINCQLSIPNTDYKKNQKTVYFGECTSDVGENWKIHFQTREEISSWKDKQASIVCACWQSPLTSFWCVLSFVFRRTTLLPHMLMKIDVDVSNDDDSSSSTRWHSIISSEKGLHFTDDQQYEPATVDRQHNFIFGFEWSIGMSYVPAPEWSERASRVEIFMWCCCSMCTHSTLLFFSVSFEVTFVVWAKRIPFLFMKMLTSDM